MFNQITLMFHHSRAKKSSFGQDARLMNSDMRSTQYNIQDETGSNISGWVYSFHPFQLNPYSERWRGECWWMTSINLTHPITLCMDQCPYSRHHGGFHYYWLSDEVRINVTLHHVMRGMCIPPTAKSFLPTVLSSAHSPEYILYCLRTSYTPPHVSVGVDDSSN